MRRVGRSVTVRDLPDDREEHECAFPMVMHIWVDKIRCGEDHHAVYRFETYQQTGHSQSNRSVPTFIINHGGDHGCSREQNGSIVPPEFRLLVTQPQPEEGAKDTNGVQCQEAG